MKIKGFKLYMLPVLLLGIPLAVIGLSGCEMFASHTNPLADWKQMAPVGCIDGEMSAEVSTIPGYSQISDDVQTYVNQLPVDQGPTWDPSPRRWCYWLEDMAFYEDGTGQHAVGFTILHDGTSWGYVLIYDKNNKRIKTGRYVIGHYSC